MVTRHVTIGAFPGQFSTWTPGTVRPIGAGMAGVTNVGSRLGPSLGAAYTQIGSPTMEQGLTCDPNTHYSGLEIWGEVFVPAASTGVTMTDCIIHCPNKAITSVGGIRGASQNCRGFIGTNLTIDLTGRESPQCDAVKGTNCFLYYCDITRTNDGMGWSGTADGGACVNTAIYNGYFTAWRKADGTVYPNFPPSPSDNKSHSDGVQWQGYGGMLIDGCSIGGTPTHWAAGDLLNNRDSGNPTSGYSGSPLSPTAGWTTQTQRAFQQHVDSGQDYQDTAILVQNNVGAGHLITGTIQRNWLAGGTSTLNLNVTASDALDGLTVINNRLVPNKDDTAATHGFGLYMNNTCNATVTGNVDDSTGLLVPINYVEGGTGTQPS